MKNMVVYDSNYGNTKIIANEIAKILGDNTTSVSINDLGDDWEKGVELLIVGSPINGWRASEKMEKFLTKLKPNQLTGIKAASFDTRINVFFHGDAAKSISKRLQNSGASILVSPRAFFVKGTEGPLADGEIENAHEWAELVKRLSNENVVKMI